MKKLLLAGIFIGFLSTSAFAHCPPLPGETNPNCVVTSTQTQVQHQTTNVHNRNSNQFNPVNNNNVKNNFNPKNTNTNNVNVTNSGGNGNGWNGNWPVSAPYAPTVMSGPCTGVGASGGLTVPIFGVTVGGNKLDRVCQLHMIGQDDVARSYLCKQDADLKQAFADAGVPCDNKVEVVETISSTDHAREKIQHQTQQQYCGRFPHVPECHGVK